ncbi:hypothetical protein [Candidatus Liberibacter americanus]|nr:hypothetical protein [Candidatus Liberibacter americanus]
MLYLHREEQARKEGILDAGAFHMGAALSGLSGASLSMWVGQRYLDSYRNVINARTSREQTVSRFMKEANWHRENKQATEHSTEWSKAATLLTGLSSMVAPAYELYNVWSKK